MKNACENHRSQWTSVVLILFCILLPQFGQTQVKTSLISLDINVNDKYSFSQIVGGNLSHYGNRVNNWNSTAFSQIKDIGIKDIRTHDIKVFDWDLIFKDWNADENIAESYDFKAADSVMSGIIKLGFYPFFRIGVSYGVAKANRIIGTNPPNPQKFARIAERIIAHYVANWANGFEYPIKYVEIWNEPDLKFFTGTDDQFKQLFVSTLRYIKEKHPLLKVGGCGVANFSLHDNYGEKFISYLSNPDGDNRTNDRVPLDFFSWHVYEQRKGSYIFIKFANMVRASLDRNGFSDTESICSEWNVSLPSNYNNSINAANDVLCTLINAEKLMVSRTYFYPLIETWGLFKIKNFGTSAYSKNNVDFYWTPMARAFDMYYSFKKEMSKPLLVNFKNDQNLQVLAGTSIVGNVNILLAYSKMASNSVLCILKLKSNTKYKVLQSTLTGVGLQSIRHDVIITDKHGLARISSYTKDGSALLIKIVKSS